jgi:SCY1-like protein 1
MALSATADLFSEEDCASKLLPVMCPSLVDKEKMIRDQAQKTVDIYITRIRKYTATMPDTVLPPPSIASASGGNAAPRMGTPANDSTWTGWAISSFTNKLAAASGQMQAGTATNGGSDQRSRSVPPPAVPTASKPTLTPSSRPGMSLTKSAAEIPTIASPDPADAFNDDAEDFDGDWGGFGEDAAFGTSNSASKKQEEDDPWGAPNVTPSPAKNFDDKGEPDFAGWLAAQNQAKGSGTKMLPKGLGKSSTATKKTVVAKTAGAPNVKRVIVAEKKEVKKSEPQKNEDEDEGWGDAW